MPSGLQHTHSLDWALAQHLAHRFSASTGLRIKSKRLITASKTVGHLAPNLSPYSTLLGSSHALFPPCGEFSAPSGLCGSLDLDHSQILAWLSPSHHSDVNSSIFSFLRGPGLQSPSSHPAPRLERFPGVRTLPGRQTFNTSANVCWTQ